MKLRDISGLLPELPTSNPFHNYVIKGLGNKEIVIDVERVADRVYSFLLPLAKNLYPQGETGEHAIRIHSNNLAQAIAKEFPA